MRIVVPFSPGGVTDNSGAAYRRWRSARAWASRSIVDNKPGASGNIGTQLVAQAAPDGYTLVLGFDGTMVINPHMFAKIPFDTLRDFAPVTKLGDAALILVSHPSVPAKNLSQFIDFARKTKGRVSLRHVGHRRNAASRRRIAEAAHGFLSSTSHTKAAGRR